jgi:invasion protein IalB
MSRISACLRRLPHSPWLASFFTQVERARRVPIAEGRSGHLSGILSSQVLVARLGLALCLFAGLAGRAEAGAASEAAPAATGPGSVVRETHGAWQVSCRTPPGAKEEKCALVQSVTAEDRPNVGLTVVFYKAIGEEKKLMRVVVPLGVLLPTGLGLKIDGQDVGNAPFLKCSRRGCVAEVVLQDDIIAKMKKGTTAMFIIFDTPEAGIGIPVALQGFGDALGNLK